MVLMESDYKRMKKGTEAPDFSLPGTDGKTYSLGDFIGSKAVLIVFMCNHCPYVIPRMNEINRIAKDYKEKKVVVVGINPNDAKKYPDDSFDNMKKLMEEHGYEFLYLRDETQEVAKTYGAVCTPDPFLFDKDLKLIFHSRIDDSHGADLVSKHEMHNAIGEYVQQGTISLEEKPSMGCSIKWKE